MNKKQELYDQYKKLIPGLELEDLDCPNILRAHSCQHQREAEYFETYEPRETYFIELHWKLCGYFEELATKLEKETYE